MYTYAIQLLRKAASEQLDLASAGRDVPGVQRAESLATNYMAAADALGNLMATAEEISDASRGIYKPLADALANLNRPPATDPTDA